MSKKDCILSSVRTVEVINLEMKPSLFPIALKLVQCFLRRVDFFMTDLQELRNFRIQNYGI